MLLYKSFFKRAIDFTASALLLLTLFLPLLLVSVLIKLDSKGPLFFTQKRVGKNLKVFKVYKFRTMTNEKREVGNIIGKAAGVTKIGYYLRKFKIDELPQVLNVLFGEMSLVGPRPSIVEQLATMSEREIERYSIRPGLTGLAQVSGNIHLSWPERYKLDLLYVENVSFYNDVLILLRTAVIVVRGEERYLNNMLKINSNNE